MGDEIFSVGGMAEDPAYQLFGARAATRLSDGRVAIANSGTSQIRFYGSDGTHLADVGREGGPGEFRYITGLTPTGGDSLLVTSRNPGFTLIDPYGEVVGSQSLGADYLPGITRDEFDVESVVMYEVNRTGG